MIKSQNVASVLRDHWLRQALHRRRSYKTTIISHAKTRDAVASGIEREQELAFAAEGCINHHRN
jgi:hypothetical protein